MKDSRVTPNQAAKLLGVSADQVRAWCESGSFKSYRSIKRWRKIERVELIAFAKRHPELVAPPKGSWPAVSNPTA